MKKACLEYYCRSKGTVDLERLSRPARTCTTVPALHQPRATCKEVGNYKGESFNLGSLQHAKKEKIAQAQTATDYA